MTTATSTAALVPRAVLLGRPDRFSPWPSEDGRDIVYLAYGDGTSGIWQAPLRSPRQARALWSAGEVIRDIQYCCGGRHVLYLTDHNGDERWRLHVLDPATGQRRSVTPDRPGVRAGLLAHNGRHPHHAVVGLNLTRPDRQDAYRVDLRTGRKTLLAHNGRSFSRWLVDRDLVVRGGVEVHPDAALTVHHRHGPDGDFEPLLRLEPDHATDTDIIGFDHSGRLLYLATSLDSDVRRLVEVDTRSGTRRVLAERPGRDLDRVFLHPDSFVPDLVCYASPRPVYAGLTGDARANLTRLLDHDEGPLAIRRTAGDRHWLVTYQRPDRPVRYCVYQPETGRLDQLFPHRDDLDERVLAPVEPFTFTARDGVTLHGYLTRPRGQRGAGPAVLLVHGGPWSRDTWTYDPIVQWVANRGYTCLQVNFRGSTGYGNRFTNLGNQQWGGTMLHDLLDTVSHAAGQGWVDPRRVGVFGGSYGGYAALASMAFHPGVFRCAVSLCGPSNLVTLLESLPPDWAPLRATMFRRVGHPERQRDLLLAQSPLVHADSITDPVLIAHGANDRRVNRRESESAAGRLRDRGVECELMIFDDEGHGLVKSHNILRFYAAAEHFLARHLGGRFEAT